MHHLRTLNHRMRCMNKNSVEIVQQDVSTTEGPIRSLTTELYDISGRVIDIVGYLWLVYSHSTIQSIGSARLA